MIKKENYEESKINRRVDLLAEALGFNFLEGMYVKTGGTRTVARAGADAPARRTRATVRRRYNRIGHLRYQVITREGYAAILGLAAGQSMDMLPFAAAGATRSRIARSLKHYCYNAVSRGQGRYEFFKRDAEYVIRRLA